MWTTTGLYDGLRKRQVNGRLAQHAWVKFGGLIGREGIESDFSDGRMGTRKVQSGHPKIRFAFGFGTSFDDRKLAFSCVLRADVHGNSILAICRFS